MDVTIFGGQSNMQGQTESLPANNAPAQGALECRYKTNELVSLSLQHPDGHKGNRTRLFIRRKTNIWGA